MLAFPAAPPTADSVLGAFPSAVAKARPELPNKSQLPRRTLWALALLLPALAGCTATLGAGLPLGRGAGVGVNVGTDGRVGIGIGVQVGAGSVRVGGAAQLPTQAPDSPPTDVGAER